MKELKQIKLLKQLEEGYVTFDNSGSDIVATDVKAAIKEVNEKVKKIDVAVEANEVNYTDNKGLGATNAQEAIDKTVDKIPAHAGQIGFTSAQGIVANNVGGALDELKQDLANAGGASTAQDVSYDDSTTNLGATNVQDVIKILDTNIKNVNAGITLANNEW